MPDCPESWLDNRFRCGIRCATKRRFGGGGGLGAAINDEGAIFTVLSIGNSQYVARVYRP